MATAVYEGVSLQVLWPDSATENLTATVIDRGDEMVIEIPAREENPIICIKGSRIDYYFAGKDDYPGGHERWELIARWAKLGDVYTGIWLVSGGEALFSFRLPKKPTRKG